MTYKETAEKALRDLPRFELGLVRITAVVASLVSAGVLKEDEDRAYVLEEAAQIADGCQTDGKSGDDDLEGDARARLIAERIRALAVVSPEVTKPEPTDDELHEYWDAAWPPVEGDVLRILNTPSPWHAFVEGFRAGYVAGQEAGK